MTTDEIISRCYEHGQPDYILAADRLKELQAQLAAQPAPDAMREAWSALARLRSMTPVEFKAYHSCVDLFEAALRSISAPARSPDGDDHDRKLWRKREAILEQAGLTSPSDDVRSVLADKIARIHRIMKAKLADMPFCDTDLKDLLSAEAALRSAPVSAPARIELRKLVDVVWNECSESTAVPSTKWADKLIDRVFTCAPAVGVTREAIQQAADYLYEETTKLDAPISYTACLVLAKHLLGSPAPDAAVTDAINSACDLVRDAVIEECANIALAIDSGRGNEKEIARAIRSLASGAKP